MQGTHNIATDSYDTGLHAFVLTKEKIVGPLSFMSQSSWPDEQGRAEKEKAITPTYRKLDELNSPKIITPETIFDGFSRESNGDLKITNELLLKRQKGILLEAISKAAKQLFEGKHVVGLSLPVRIFHERSAIERMADIFTFAPYYLNQAAADEGVDRMKYIMGFLMAGVPMAICQWKPFNPILGETFEGELSDGTTIHSEHISHHPPITRFLLVNKNWKIHGSMTYNGKIGTNSFTAFNEGWCTVEFNDGEKFKFVTPCLSLKGMMMGTRKIQYVTSVMLVDEKRKIKATIKFNAEAKSGITSMFKSSRQDSILGSIYTYDEQKHLKMCEGADKKWYAMLKEFGEMKDAVQTIAKIEGSWLDEVRIDGKAIWNLKDVCKHATPHKYSENPLPSDCRFREDVIWLARNDQEQSQAWKTILEIQQRKDRANRSHQSDKKH